MKKKSICLFYCAIVYTCFLPFPLFSQETGDVNSDGSVNIIDALLVAQYYVGLDPANFNPGVADINCDNNINIVDALLVARFYVGLITAFPDCSPTPVPTSIPTPASTPAGTSFPTAIPTPGGITSGPTSQPTPTLTPPPPTQTPEPPPVNVTVEWQKMFGGSGVDEAFSVQITSDNNGIIVAGPSESGDIEGCTSHGGIDIYMVKLDIAGNLLWQRMIGGSNDDNVFAILSTPDNGCIVAGSSDSTDIAGCLNRGSDDYFIVKLDGDGNIVWQKMFGGNDSENAYAIQETADNGYVIAGASVSADIAGNINHGAVDFYIVKCDEDGNSEWEKLIGGSGTDEAFSISITPDNGFVVAGYSYSTDIEGCVNGGFGDYFIVKLDATGNIEWQKMVGGSDSDIISTILVAPDNQYMIAGYSSSHNIEGCTNRGAYDILLIKLDADGNNVWQEMMGGNGNDYPFSMQTVPGNGYIIGGSTDSTDISGLVNHGNYDFYLVKLGSDGFTEWQQTFGGSNADTLRSIQVTADQTYIAAGYTQSVDIGGCVNHGDEDVYVVTLY